MILHNINSEKLNWANHNKQLEMANLTLVDIEYIE
jgi:hypothetical protein